MACGCRHSPKEQAMKKGYNSMVKSMAGGKMGGGKMGGGKMPMKPMKKGKKK